MSVGVGLEALPTWMLIDLAEARLDDWEECGTVGAEVVMRLALRLHHDRRDVTIQGSRASLPRRVAETRARAAALRDRRLDAARRLGETDRASAARLLEAVGAPRDVAGWAWVPAADAGGHVLWTSAGGERVRRTLRLTHTYVLPQARRTRFGWDADLRVVVYWILDGAAPPPTGREP